MDRPRTQLNLSLFSRPLVSAILLAFVVAGAGCKIARPLSLPVVGSMGEVDGQWDDLDVYLVDPDGNTPAVRLTDTPGLMETDPDLNRDRTQVVYVARAVTPDGLAVLGREAGPMPAQIIVSNTDASERRVLHQSGSMCFTPVWSHDGKRIAFAEMNAERRIEVKLINADGSGLQTLGYGSGPSWRKDDGAIFYSSIDQVGAKEGNLLLRELSTGVFHELGLPGTGHTNLRTGVSVAYSSTPYSRRNETIWLMDANGGQFRLTEPGAEERDLQPVFFDSEGELVFTRYDDEAGSYRLMRIRRDTDDKVATAIDQPTPVCFTRGGLWVAMYYPR